VTTGGLTNAVLHYFAIAHAAEVKWTIEDFERIRQRVPVICDLKPSGKYVAIDLRQAGAIPQVLKILLDAGLLHGDCITITGRTLAEELNDVPLKPRADQEVILPLAQNDTPMRERSRPCKVTGGDYPLLRDPPAPLPKCPLDSLQCANSAIKIMIRIRIPRKNSKGSERTAFRHFRRRERTVAGRPQ
jgi:Dehydratase family